MAHAGPLWLVLGPALAALLLLALARRRVAGLGALVAAVAAATFAGTVALAPAVLAHGRVVATLPAVLGELRFALDGVGLVFALVATCAWTLASIYATGYLHGGPHAARYHATSLIALSAMLGVVVAGDLITLYVFFEWLGLVAYLYVVHVGGPVAERAGLKYLILTLLGGFAVLAGALLVQVQGGGDLAQPLLVDPTPPGLRAAVALLLVLGFGVKAGALGLHLWLPDAHSAAPAPASALLSGVMIKAGAYGILRTLVGLVGGGAPEATGEALALAVLWWGIATMSIGVVMALLQTHAKRLLAYSSVSQMGFVLAGFGAAALLGDHGAAGWTGSLLHVANHALAKGLLFLGVGAVVHATGETDLRRLGGLARRMPWTFAVVLIGAGGIAGLPGLNGFVSKSVLHHALVHVAEEGGAPGLAWAERIFVATTVGTAAALVKLVAMAFLGRPAVARPVHETPWTMRGPMLAAAGAVVALGVAPGALGPLLASGASVLRPAAAPAAETVAAWVGAPIGHAADLRAAALAIALGMLVHGVARRVGAYAWVPPGWLSLDELVRRGLVGVGGAVAALAVLAARAGAWWRFEWSLLVGLASPQGAVRQRAGRHWRVRVLLLVHRLLRRASVLVRAAERLDASLGLVEPAARTRMPSIGLSPKEQDRWVQATRRRIARHARDLGLGVGVLFLTWLAFVAVVARGGGW